MTDVEILGDRAALVRETGARVAACLRALLDEQERATVALTGGSVGIEVLGAIPAEGIDWQRVHVTWSDERFVAAESPDRNAGQARPALLERVPIPAANVVELPATDGPDGNDPDAAAERATDALRALGRVDLALLGVGPDAHCASLFPGHPGVEERGARVIAVRDSPKPPPERLSFTLDAIAACDRVWLVVAGDDKAEAVRLALSGADASVAPSGAARGRLETRWLLDEEAAALIA